MRRRAVLLGALAALGLGGSAAPEPWTVLREASTIEMSVRAFGGSHRGRFDNWRGDIAFDPDAPGRTSATVVVQTGSLTMNPAAVTGRAVGPAFLDARRYPTIRFELRSLEALGGDRYSAHAEVTMKGRTRPAGLASHRRPGASDGRVHAGPHGIRHRNHRRVEQDDRPRGDGAGGASGAPRLGATDAQAAEALAAGALVILPTETVYGLAADAGNAAAVAAIFEAKGRPRFNPLIAHVADAVAAEAIAVFDDRARALAEAFWPGPLTIVAPVRDRARVCDLARAGLDSVAVRVPGHVRARGVISAFGRPVVAPSANRSGRPSPTTFEDAMEETGFAAADAVDGGPCAVGVESTVVSVLDGRIALLRPGSVTREEIEAVVGPLDRDGEGHRSPGRTALHYAPDAPVRINAASAGEGEILLGFGPGVGDRRWSLSPSGDLREAAANLFRKLREADREKPAGIAVSPIPAQGLGEAINDRLKRAAGFVG